MKKGILIGFVGLMAVLIASSAVADTSSISGKLIALDAGHGGDYVGGYNILHDVAEKDVNMDVVLSLKERLEGAGAIVVLTREGDETILDRSDRVDIAVEQCLALGDRKCDILVSVHHNGSTDVTHDGTLTIYNERQDKALAEALHDTLVPITGLDEGYLNGGYGITVFDHIVSTLTEAYYVTNDDRAYAYLYNHEEVIEEEVLAQFEGIVNYFTAMEDVPLTGKKGR